MLDVLFLNIQLHPSRRNTTCQHYFVKSLSGISETVQTKKINAEVLQSLPHAIQDRSGLRATFQIVNELQGRDVDHDSTLGSKGNYDLPKRAGTVVKIRDAAINRANDHLLLDPRIRAHKKLPRDSLFGFSTYGSGDRSR